MSTMLDKIWEAHVVHQEEGKPDLLYVDRHLIHEVTSPQAFEGLRQAGRKVRRPELTYAVVDHVTPTCDKRVRPLADEIAEAQLAAIERNTAENGISFFNMDDDRQGVIHVTMPERGITLPGHTIMCGDSHTATHGAFGALAFGIGTSEVEHILASQTLYQFKPKTMAVKAEGLLGKGVTAKDLILHVIGILGAGGGTGYAIEFMGQAVEALSMEARMTLCNMAIECGAKSGMVAPDQTTFDWIEGREKAPKDENFARAVEEWKKLKSDSLDEFDHVIEIDASKLAPQVTWGINPGQESALDAPIPAPESFQDPDERKACEKALDYQGLKAGMRMIDAKIDYVFIGSCTNGRIEDLRQAAAIAKGRKVAEGVTALVVPGSGAVKAQAIEEGLDKIFTEAGFEWREPGCSMCLAMNPDVLPAGLRCASTSNRNFEDRQGRGGRTHLVSPASAAAAAIKGHFVDPREMMEG